ncbi:hypothetical protein Sjap_020504 [Stephania japonica]|uniref:G domain-containing protein n=1 Tax=Stephania japonica TaxID=461633 RepID=A0AAP0F3H8_9MAGN
MGKSEKTGLGRALVKHHNQMAQQSKDKGRLYRNQGKKVLESVTHVSDIEAVIELAEEAERLHSFDHPAPDLLINLDGAAAAGMTDEEWREKQKEEEALHAASLRVPRRTWLITWQTLSGGGVHEGKRELIHWSIDGGGDLVKRGVWELIPPWTPEMSLEELDASETQAFLEWRRSLARRKKIRLVLVEAKHKPIVPSILHEFFCMGPQGLVMVVDARDPLFYRCPDLEAYAREIDKSKQTLLLVNKADLLPLSVRRKWAKYFHDHGILFLFWSAKVASASLDSKKLNVLGGDEQDTQCSEDIDTRIYGRDELLARLQGEAEAIAASRSTSCNDPTSSRQELSANYRTSKQVVVGFVGYPNVGKSSTINALVGEKRTGVTSTPGKTKHFQTLIISDELMLCDCPGLVFPSFTSSRYDMIASGVLPIDRMTEHKEAVQVVANHVPRHIIEKVYNIRLPNPKPYESQSRPPLASEFLRSYCYSRGHFAASGLPDETRAARQILKDYIDGKLPHFELPPGMTAEADGEVNMAGSSSSATCEMNLSDTKDERTVEDRILEDLNLFDITDGSGLTKATAVKKPNVASYKHHKKPERKKDRSWRVGRDADEVIHEVRAFQKPINVGPVKTE